MKDEIILLREFIKEPKLELTTNNALFVGKTKDSMLIGPYIDAKFDYDAFYRRIISSCIYSKRTYRRITKKRAEKYIDTHNLMYKNITNSVMEIFDTGEIISHNLLFM